MTLRAIEINKSTYEKPVDVPQGIGRAGQVDIKLFLPPIDIPEYILPAYNEVKDIFLIEFKYSSREKEKKLFEDELINFIVGEFSGKPLRIEMKNIRQNKIDKISLTNIIKENISHVMQERLRHINNLRERTNLLRAKEVLEQKAPEIAQEMVMA